MGRTLSRAAVVLAVLASTIVAMPALAQASPSLSIADISVAEGDSGTSTAQVTVTKTGTTNQFVEVDWNASDETALFSDADYYDTTGHLFFSPSETTKTITVTIVGDTVDEPDETFVLDLSNPINATISDGIGRVTITDNDSPVIVSISDVSVVEGDSGSQAATFTISLSRAVSDGVSVSYATSDGSATFSGGDYFQTSGTVAFSPGQISRTITVQVVGDMVDESDETFLVTLSNPNGVVLGDSSGAATIIDNDTAGGGGGGGGTPPTVAITDQSLAEGNSGTTMMVFTVSLSSAATGTVTVDYETARGTAIEGQDFTSVSGQLVFAAGETSKTVAVLIIGDLVDEENETLSLFLPRVQGATFADASGVGTIIDDDGMPTLSVADVSTLEGDDGTTDVVLTLQLSGPSAEFVTVDLQTADGTATFDDGDFYFTSGTIAFQPGQTQRTVAIAVVGDLDAEPDEYFYVELSNIDGATLGDPSALIDILNDEPIPTTTSLTVGKAPDALTARGKVTPAITGGVVVKLLKKRAGRFVLLQTRRPLLVEQPDAPTPHSTYRAVFRRPAGGTCRIVAVYQGSGSFERSSARATFPC